MGFGVEPSPNFNFSQLRYQFTKIELTAVTNGSWGRNLLANMNPKRDGKRTGKSLSMKMAHERESWRYSRQTSLER